MRSKDRAPARCRCFLCTASTPEEHHHELLINAAWREFVAAPSERERGAAYVVMQRLIAERAPRVPQ